jgi:GNAT superfamily N-acetyltransferase
MEPERIDPLDLDEGTADGLAMVANAEIEADQILSPPLTGASLRAAARFASDDRPVDGLWVTNEPGGNPIAYGVLELPRWDNPGMAQLSGHVHPDLRGQGVGTTLLRAQMQEAGRAGRNILLAFTYAGTPSVRLLVGEGFEVGQRMTQRRIDVSTMDLDRMADLVTTAQQHAGDYELVQLRGPAPEEWVPQLCAIFAAINDAPLDDLDLEPDEFSVDRLRSYERAMLGREQDVCRLMARHRRTGEWAGHTILCVDGLRPGVGHQEDTTVLPAHRGHRLGLLLKATMLLWVHDIHPELTTIDTWNADTNGAMITVNELLGCRPANQGVVLQRRL